jgi:hypothetical protein
VSVGPSVAHMELLNDCLLNFVSGIDRKIIRRSTRKFVSYRFNIIALIPVLTL